MWERIVNSRLRFFQCSKYYLALRPNSSLSSSCFWWSDNKMRTEERAAGRNFRRSKAAFSLVVWREEEELLWYSSNVASLSNEFSSFLLCCYCSSRHQGILLERTLYTRWHDDYDVCTEEKCIRRFSIFIQKFWNVVVLEVRFQNNKENDDVRLLDETSIGWQLFFISRDTKKSTKRAKRCFLDVGFIAFLWEFYLSCWIWCTAEFEGLCWDGRRPDNNPAK